MDGRLNSSWWALRIGLGLAPFLAGLDKFFNLLTNWSKCGKGRLRTPCSLSQGSFGRAPPETGRLEGLSAGPGLEA